MLYINLELISAALPVSRFRRIIKKYIESSIISALNNSLASKNNDGEITVTEELEVSDYVLTLRDPNEEQ